MTIIVPGAAGASSDIMARIIADKIFRSYWRISTPKYQDVHLLHEMAGSGVPHVPAEGDGAPKAAGHDGGKEGAGSVAMAGR